MENIINNSVLLGEIRRIIKEEVQKEIPKSQINSLWKWLNRLHERIKVLEKKNE